MGINRYMYKGYGTEYLTKSDCTPKMLFCKFGVTTTAKKIREVLANCEIGTITTGGYYIRKHSKVYSVAKLIELLGE